MNIRIPRPKNGPWSTSWEALFYMKLAAVDQRHWDFNKEVTIITPLLLLLWASTFIRGPTLIYLKMLCETLDMWVSWSEKNPKCPSFSALSLSHTQTRRGLVTHISNWYTPQWDYGEKLSDQSSCVETNLFLFWIIKGKDLKSYIFWRRKKLEEARR